MDDNMNRLADALNDHQVTDDTGEVREEDTSFEDTAAQESNTVEDAPETQQETQTPKSEDDADFGTDDAGNRYVPEKRFSEIYGKAKRLERELENLKKSQTQPVDRQTKLPTVEELAPVKIDRAEALEVEILREKWPQLDPDNPDYSRELDEMGGEIYQANPGITRLEAARRALARAKKLGMAERSLKDEARLVKTQQADQGITSRVSSRQDTKPNVDSMTDQELEAYLKANGEWNLRS